ncbi:response regulator [Dyadobacter psychrotolerans]|uniref:Response regulator n=1 Tax=Dyadobacter psychrotolerans TaxID=2541721 RepID=A0A4R5DNS0_9BACT|nr:response regulator [Dyadobacter psychrotolerans]TDE15207.1 response regulator [Dyadobacter psychrotolerans]
MASNNKVLLVEDVYILFEQVQTFLTRKGLEVLEIEQGEIVNSYEKGVILFNQHKPSLAVLDIEINGENDGIDLGTYIRGISDIPIIFLSKYYGDAYLQRIKVIQGANFVLKAKKPFDMRQLWIQIEIANSQQKHYVDQKNDLDSRSEQQKAIDLKNEVIVLKVIELNSGMTLPDDEAAPSHVERTFHFDQITFIQSANKTNSDGNNNVEINLKDKRVFRNRQTIKGIGQLLPEFMVKCNQSVIVNANYIDCTLKASNLVRLTVNKQFTVAVNCRENVLKQWQLAIARKK